jgi:uncharacterized protein (DUF302 family)
LAETALPLLVCDRWQVICFILGTLCLSACAPAAAHSETEVIQRETHTKSFEDVIFDLEFAITQRNFRITARNDIGRGIRSRGFKDFPQAIIIHFCNLTLAQAVLELDPVFITHMPCRVAVYDHGNRITVSTTSLPENSDNPRVNAFSRKINAMLRGILNFAVD